MIRVRTLSAPLPDHVGWNYGILAATAAFEFDSWRVSYRALRRRKDSTANVFDEIVGSKDPAVFTVSLEDLAGLMGTVLAFPRSTFKIGDPIGSQR